MRETFVGAKESQGHRDQLSCLWWVVRRRDGILENALHPLDIDEIEAQGSLASGFHASMAVLVGQAHELLSLSELGPWKDAAEEQTHETADVVAEFLGLAHHTLRVAPGVGLEVWGVVCVVGRSSSGWFSRVGFDELAFVVDAYERFIASYRDLLSHVDRGNRVQGLEELHVVVVMNGRLGPLRRIESRPVHGPKASKLDLFEDDERAFLGGPVNTPARDFQTPTSSFPLDVSQVEPLLTAEKTLSNIRHPLDVLKRHHRGESQRRIAVATGRGRKTIRAYIREAKKLGWSKEVPPDDPDKSQKEKELHMPHPDDKIKRET